MDTLGAVGRRPHDLLATREAREQMVIDDLSEDEGAAFLAAIKS